MSFNFQWEALNNDEAFHIELKKKIENALNNPSSFKPPNVVAPFEVKDFFLGTKVNMRMHTPSLNFITPYSPSNVRYCNCLN